MLTIRFAFVYCDAIKKKGGGGGVTTFMLTCCNDRSVDYFRVYLWWCNNNVARIIYLCLAVAATCMLIRPIIRQ